MINITLKKFPKDLLQEYIDKICSKTLSKIKLKIITNNISIHKKC